MVFLLVGRVWWFSIVVFECMLGVRFSFVRFLFLGRLVVIVMLWGWLMGLFGFVLCMVCVKGV